VFRVEVYIEAFAAHGETSFVYHDIVGRARGVGKRRVYGGRPVEAYRHTVLSDYNMARGSGCRGVAYARWSGAAWRSPSSGHLCGEQGVCHTPLRLR